VAFSDRTLTSLAALLAAILRATVVATKRGEVTPHKPRVKRSAEAGRSAIQILTTLCTSAESAAGWQTVVDLANEIADLRKMPLRDYLNEQRFPELYGELAAHLMEGLTGALKDGNLQLAETFFSRVRIHTGLRERAKERLTDLLAKDSAALPSAAQEWIMHSLGIESEQEGKSLLYVSSEEDPQIQNAASLLLLLWDHAGKGDTYKEMFERYRELCSAHFSLELKGDVGAVVPFDGRRHEMPGRNSGTVRVVRPCVELVSPPSSRVVIRALVEPA
jgi:hypothetical protein